MRFSALRNDFGDAVTQVVRALPGRPVTPVLGGVKLSVEGGTLTVSGFDYETSTRTMVPTETTYSEGAVLVSGRLLSEVVKVLPKKPVEVEVDGSRLVVTAGTARYSLPVMPVEDYPELPVFPSVAGSVSAEEFAAAVASVALALTKDDAQPMLAGIRVETTQDTLTLVATDRYRLALREVSWAPNEAGSLEVLVPGRTMVDASRIPDTGAVELCLSDSLFGITRVGWETTTRVLDAQFPPYRKLIPEVFAATTTVDAAEFAAAVKRMAVVSGVCVRCEFDEGAVTLTAQGESGQASETVEAVHAGPPVTISFNPGYLVDGVTVSKSPEVVVSMNAANRPTVITGVDAQGEPVPGWLYLLMPTKGLA